LRVAHQDATAKANALRGTQEHDAVKGLHMLGVTVPFTNLVRDGLLVVIFFLSLMFTKASTRADNFFTWEPILEVAKLFAAIFLTIIPVLKILQSGVHGQLADVIWAVLEPNNSANNVMYFWLTGMLSSFLDNAPTYVVFFNTAGGDAASLMSPEGATTLLAISAGAVFMGANTYIGNAPNFMVKSIAEENEIKMPSFFGYMAWSFGILIPIFVLLTLVFFVNH
jgi:Na+/H+ antiporter NhaD/arsenite permease-like protein